MAHWLVKSEPAKYSWQLLVKDGRTHWNGVRNFQAANNLKAMLSTPMRTPARIVARRSTGSPTASSTAPDAT